MNLEQFETWLQDLPLQVTYGRTDGVYVYRLFHTGPTYNVEVFRDKNPMMVKVFIKGFRAGWEIQNLS
jgi:hypothetical protein